MRRRGDGKQVETPMIIKRRTLGLWAGSSLLLNAVSLSAFADPEDTVTKDDKGEGHREVHIHGKKQHAGATTAQFLQHGWTIDFKSKAVAEDDWKRDFPEHGQASVLIDYKGNWQYSGSFPSQPLNTPCRVTVGIGLKGSLGKIMAFSHTMTVFHDGASWSKTGHDQIVEDLWKDVVKGHEWAWAAHFRQERPHEPPPQQVSRNGGGGDSTASQVADDIGKSLLGPIGFFF
jgi:hypothetical protein